MKLHNISFLFCIIFFITTSARADVGIDVIRDEDYIPFQAIMQRDWHTQDGSLLAGERVVVLRPLSSDSIRVDVARKGIFTLPVDATDVCLEIDRAKKSTDSNFKLIPRMALFLTNRMISGESGWQNPLPIERVYAFDRWILLYGDANTEDTRAAVTKAIDFYSSLPENECIQTALLYMDVVGNKAAIQLMAEELEPSIQCMPGYLSKGYTGSLDHINADHGLPQLVEVASSGRIIDRVEGLQAVDGWFDKQ
jgi:hypothetical protein